MLDFLMASCLSCLRCMNFVSCSCLECASFLPVLPAAYSDLVLVSLTSSQSCIADIASAVALLTSSGKPLSDTNKPSASKQ